MYRQYISIHCSYKGLFLHDERCRDALFMNIQNLALGPTQRTHQGWGMCSKGVEVISTKNLLFSNHFQILNASIPYHAP